MNNNIYNSSPPPVTKTYSRRKRNQTDSLMNNHPSSNNKRANVKPLRNIKVVRQHNKSISIIIYDVNAYHNSDNNKDKGCSYKNCLIKNQTLEYCATKKCLKTLHHMCQNNIDNVQYNGDFETEFCLMFCYSERIVERMKHVSPYEKNVFDSDTEFKSEEEE